MKVLLAAPRNALPDLYCFPVGMAYVASALRREGHEVLCLNEDVCEKPDRALAAALRDFAPDLLGVGGMTPSFGRVREMIGVARGVRADMPVMVGGGLFSSEPELVLSALGADFGIFGEGEESAAELARALETGTDPGLVPGVLARGPGASLTPRDPIRDLDALAHPDYEGFGLAESLRRRRGEMVVIASRGCPFSCTFCYCALGRKSYRQRSLDSLFSEIEALLSRYDVGLLGVMDEVFATRRERVLDFCGRIKPLGVAWYTQLRVDGVDRECLEAMRDAGCVMISYGLESMSPEVLRSMNKKISPAKISAALEATYESRIRVFGNFIFGDPAETPETAGQTLSWWLANRRYGINLGHITCYPGTRIYREAVERGIIPDKLAFIEQGCPLTNITHREEEFLLRLVSLAEILHRTLLFPARIVSARAEGDAWNLTALCPHCGTANDLAGLSAASAPKDRTAPQAACAQCHRNFDVLCRAWAEPEAQAASSAVAEARKLRTSGDLEGAASVLLPLVREGRATAGVWSALGRIRLEQGRLEHAYEALRQALFADPSRPASFTCFAAVLEAMGRDDLSWAFADQAVLTAYAAGPDPACADDPAPSLRRPGRPLEQILETLGIRYA